LISILTLIYFHYFIKKHTNTGIANISVILLSVQSLFLAQSSLVLPEMLLTLLLIITADSFLSKKIWLFIVSGSMMVLTKETGVIFIGCFGLFYAVENFKSIKTFKFWKHLLILSIPIWIYILYLFLHYIEFGSFFYKEHIGYISLEPEIVFQKIKSSTANIFTRYGRNILLFTTIIALAILLFKKEKFKSKRLILLSLLLIFSLVLFSSINFYTNRYTLPAFPFFILICTIILFQARFRNIIINLISLFIIIGVPLFKSVAETDGTGDNDLGYTEYLILQKNVVEYCEKQNWYNKQFSCGMNMVMAMRDYYAGYLIQEKKIKTGHFPQKSSTDLVIHDSTCGKHEFPEGSREGFKLIKHFESKNHWSNIYVRSP